MYIIIDLNTQQTWKHNGSYPIMFIEKLVQKGHRIAVISTESNTIKYNFKLDEYGELSPERDEVRID